MAIYTLFHFFIRYNKQVEQVADYLPSILNYLQFSSYQAGDVNFAAQLSAAYLVLIPGNNSLYLSPIVLIPGNSSFHCPCLPGTDTL